MVSRGQGQSRALGRPSPIRNFLRFDHRSYIIIQCLIRAESDNILAVTLKTPNDVQDELRLRFRALRLRRNLTQGGLARRSGVSLPSLRRFERTGRIAFESLLKLALVLECLSDFDKVASEDEQSLTGRSLDAVLAQKPGRKKGRLR